jgi:hypothetical protein
VLLPELSAVPVKAKIDTGARTSTLHAFDLSLRTQNGQPWVEFEIHPLQRSNAHATRVSCAVHSFRKVRSSTGHSETRPVISTPMQIGGEEFDIDVTLTARDEMGFRMLLGRGAIRRRFIVDPGESFLHAAPPFPDDEQRTQPT